MKTNDLAVRPIISAREAEKMIWAFIHHGNHSRYDVMKGAPKGPIEKWFAENNEPLHKVANRCRSFFDTAVPYVENLIGSTWFAIAEGEGSVKVELHKAGQTEPEVKLEAPGTIAVDYEAKFESACRARDRAIEGASLDEFHTCIVKGIASIESYVAHRAEIWNRSVLAREPLIDSKETKVSFDEKIKNWIPTMTGGKRLDRSGRMWNDFLFLQEIRDNDAIHAKKFAQGTSHADLADALNKFKVGIADFLFQLHVLFEEAAPRVIIRAKFFPEVYVRRKGE